MNKLYGLIFDVDGVIADTEPLNAVVTTRVLDDMFGLKGVKPEDFDAGIGKGAEKYVQAGADAHGLSLSEEQIKAAALLRERYLIEAIQQDPLSAFAGVLELIEAAFRRGDFRLAIATSGSRELSQAILESAKVPYQRMVYVNGSEITKKKPDPQLFLTAARRMGLAPARCLVIEDAPSGVQAAKAAGAKCIAVTNSTTAANLSQADLICDSLEQISVETIERLIDEQS